MMITIIMPDTIPYQAVVSMRICAFAEVKDNVMTMACVMIKHDSLGKLDKLFDRLLYPMSSQQTAEPLLDDSDLSMMASLTDEAAVPKLEGDVMIYGLQELCRDLSVIANGKLKRIVMDASLMTGMISSSLGLSDHMTS